MSSELQAFFKHLEAQRAATPKIVLLWYRLTRGTRDLHSVPSRIVNVYQRARYGFGHRDLWSFDNYIAGVISKAMHDLANTTHGYPGTEEFPTFESWREFLLGISKDLEAYNKSTTDDVADTDDLFDRIDELNERDRKRYADGVEAMHRFSSNFGSMWD